MKIVGCFEAKTHFSDLLRLTDKGEEVLITRHGKPVAKLVPAESQTNAEIKETIQKMRELRKGVSLGEGITLRELIEEGRK